MLVEKYSIYLLALYKCNIFSNNVATFQTTLHQYPHNEVLLSDLFFVTFFSFLGHHVPFFRSFSVYLKYTSKVPSVENVLLGCVVSVSGSSYRTTQGQKPSAMRIQLISLRSQLQPGVINQPRVIN